MTRIRDENEWKIVYKFIFILWSNKTIKVHITHVAGSCFVLSCWIIFCFCWNISLSLMTLDFFFAFVFTYSHKSKKTQKKKMTSSIYLKCYEKLNCEKIRKNEMKSVRMFISIMFVFFFVVNAPVKLLWSEHTTHTAIL